MQTNIYLAFYKGKGNFLNKLVRFFTKSEISHCDIALTTKEQGVYRLFGASAVDGGVRSKVLKFNQDSWILIPIAISTEELYQFFAETNGAKYDYFGAIGLVLGFKEARSRYFCSEWCFNLISKSNQGYRFSPAVLYEIAKLVGR